MTPAEVLAGARDVLAERGWHQGGVRGEDGSVCLINAIAVASAGDDGTFMVAHRLVQCVIGDRIPEQLTSIWNDAPERTYEDVVLALKQAEELAVQS